MFKTNWLKDQVMLVFIQKKVPQRDKGKFPFPFIEFYILAKKTKMSQ